MIFPRCDIEQATEVWNRVSAEIERYHAEHDQPYKISMSRGFAQYDPSERISADEFIARADQEMYNDKQSKRSRGEI